VIPLVVANQPGKAQTDGLRTDEVLMGLQRLAFVKINTFECVTIEGDSPVILTNGEQESARLVLDETGMNLPACHQAKLNIPPDR